MLLSIIVPIYNVEKYVRKCIESLLRQKLQPTEIILVDDGSTDDSGKICDEYANNDKVIVIHKKNGGLVSARQAGLEIAKGDYITFVDGDDWIDEDFYYQELNGKDNCYDMYALAYTDEYPSYSAKNYNAFPDGIYCDKEIKEKIIPACFYYNPENKKNYLGYPGLKHSIVLKIMKRDIICQVLPNMNIDITMGEDLICSYKCLELAKSIKIHSGNCGYHYVRNAYSMTRSFTLEKIKKIDLMYKELLMTASPLLKEKQLPIDAIGMLDNNIRIAYGKSYKVRFKDRLTYVKACTEVEYIALVLKTAQENNYWGLQLSGQYKRMFRNLSRKRFIRALINYLIIRVEEKVI